MRHYARKKYRQDLEGLVGLDPGALARLFKGELLAGRPYASVQWVLCLKPFRPLEVFLLFDFDPEFGADVRVLYARKSLAVPTEDAYVFGWDYLALLARYGRGAFSLEDAACSPDWIPLADFAPQAGPLENVSLGPREEALRLLSPEVVEVAVRRLDSGVYQKHRDGWEVFWTLLGDLALRLQALSSGIRLAFDSHGAQKYGPEFLMSFTWLYINALLRASRQVDPSLPRLSRYF